MCQIGLPPRPFCVFTIALFNPATWNPPASAGGGMRRNPREVALSSASRDEFNLQILRHDVCNIWVLSIPFTLQISFYSFSANVIDSTCKVQCTLFLKIGSHYYREPPAPAEGSSTRHGQYLFIFLLKFSAKTVSIIKIGFVKIKHYEKLLLKDDHAGAFDGSYLPHRVAYLFLYFKNWKRFGQTSYFTDSGNPGLCLNRD